MWDWLGSLIVAVLNGLKQIFETSTSIQPHFDFGDPFIFVLFSALYLISAYVIGKIIVGIVRWFYRI